MKKNTKFGGLAIAIAWPETWCKQSGGWYEWMTSGLGISKNHYYKAGHAALVLVDGENERCYYFDFGRYHSPFDHGRARGENTDPDLTVYTKPIISSNGKELLNFKEILMELQLNPSCHGEGKLHASYSPINFEKAYAKALEMQNRGPIPYGPFRYKGSNCSRFVNTVLKAGEPGLRKLFCLNFMVPLTPTPLNNVHSFGNQMIIENLSGKQPACPSFKPDKKFLNSTLPQPEKHPDVPENAQWLAGEGAGSWFHIVPLNSGIAVTTYSPAGLREFSESFFNENIQTQILDMKAVIISYPSHGRLITLKYKDQYIGFKPL
jgi:hypothetical protein